MNARKELLRLERLEYEPVDRDISLVSKRPFFWICHHDGPRRVDDVCILEREFVGGCSP
jgi:hypothetical protein